MTSPFKALDQHITLCASSYAEVKEFQRLATLHFEGTLSYNDLPPALQMAFTNWEIEMQERAN